jgi:hypothetical protein
MIPGIVESSRWVASFSDTFNRTNAANIATPNLEWEETIGDWQISSNTAFSGTAAASYPLAAINTFRENTSVVAYNGFAGAGFGAAFWVVDANNWWAVVSDVQTSQASGTVYTCPSGGTLSGTTCINTCYSTCYSTCYEQCCTGGYCASGSGACGGGGYAYGCATQEPGGCDPARYYNCGGMSDQNENSYDCSNDPCVACRFRWTGSYYIVECFSGVVPPSTVWSAGTVTSTAACNPYSCNPYACNPYACNYAATATTSTITTYAHSVKLLRKLAGTLSVVATQSFGSDQNTPVYLTSLSVSTVGNVINYSGLRNGSTNAYTTTAVSPTKGTKHGIILSPTTAGAQTTQVDRFDYNA